MNEVQTIDELVISFENHLRSVQRSRFTIRQYWQTWKPLKIFMSANNIEFFDITVGKQFIKSKLGSYEYANLNQMQRRLVNTVDALSVFQQTGKIHFGSAPLRRNPPKVFTGEIGILMEGYIRFRKTTFGLAKSTVNNNTRSLYALFLFLENKGIKKIDDISEVYILFFIKSLNPSTLAINHSTLGVVKGFLKYAYEEKFFSTDLSKIIQRTNYKQQPKLPSSFSKDEIKSILNSIDRSNSSGKRDYAMILLAIKLGMRVSDIAGLKFEDIDWDKHSLTFTQFKTKKSITLPLLPEIGNAIIDYLKYARAVSDESHCFLQQLSPYKKVTSEDVSRVARFYIHRSGISLKERKHGAHALRHSFASELLGNKASLPVISEALGHGHTSSTMSYLRIDINQLRQCALDVSLVSSIFYQQKGGFVS